MWGAPNSTLEHVHTRTRAHTETGSPELSFLPTLYLAFLSGLWAGSGLRGENTFQELRDLPEVTELTQSRLCSTKKHISEVVFSFMNTRLYDELPFLR